MTIYLGDFPDDATVYFRWNTTAIAGESITRATNGTISVYKDDNATQTTTGVTDTEDADSLTGVHLCKIATTDAFYAAGSEYQVVLSAATIDGKTINAVLAHFSIERAGGILALLKGANGLSAIKTQTGAIETKIDTIDDLLDTEVAAIKSVVDAILVDTAEIGAAGAGLTAVPWNASWDAEVQSEVTDALNAYDPPTNAELEARTIVAADYATASALDTVDNLLDTEVAAIKAKTDLIPGTQDGKTFAEMMMLISAVLLGKASGLDSTTAVYRSVDDGEDRVTATVDANGNRTAVTLNTA